MQEAEDLMEDGVGWLGGRWGVTIYFISIVYFFFCGMHQEAWETSRILQDMAENLRISQEE